MKFDGQTHALDESEYYKQSFPKKQIVLHFTAGYSVPGAVSSFKRNKSRTATAFAIERNGTVFQLFDPRYWALHLYRHKAGDPEGKEKYDLERGTIGIEIVNIGPLDLGKTDKDKNTLYTYTKKPYCSLDETSRYHQGTYRGKHFWQTYTHEQYESLSELLSMLYENFGIEPKSDPLAGALDYWPIEKMLEYNGVTTHGNYRRDKYDVGPAFEWARIGLQR